ncbi:hypothetical protein [Runella sp.]
MAELYAIGAWHYIQKPDTCGHLSKIVQQVFQLSQEKNLKQPPKDDFILFCHPYVNHRYEYRGTI